MSAPGAGRQPRVLSTPHAPATALYSQRLLCTWERPDSHAHKTACQSRATLQGGKEGWARGVAAETPLGCPLPTPECLGSAQALLTTPASSQRAPAPLVRHPGRVPGSRLQAAQRPLLQALGGDSADGRAFQAETVRGAARGAAREPGEPLACAVPTGKGRVAGASEWVSTSLLEPGLRACGEPSGA